MSSMTGHPMRHEMPGRYQMRRTFTAKTVAEAAAQREDIRKQGWVQLCPRLAANAAVARPSQATIADAGIRAELKHLEINVISGTVRFHEELVPGDRIGTADTTTILVVDWSNDDGAHQFWWHTDGQPATFEIGIGFDVPPDPATIQRS